MWRECLGSQGRTTVSNTLLLGAELHDCRKIRHGASASFLRRFMVLETAGSKADFLPGVRVCACMCFSKRHLMWETGTAALSLLLHFAGHLPSLKSRINSTIITQVHCANSTVFAKLRVVFNFFERCVCLNFCKFGVRVGCSHTGTSQTVVTFWFPHQCHSLRQCASL